MGVASFDKAIICPQLIGRAKSIELLEQALDSARERQGQIVLVAGEAGIGKTRLIAEIKAHAAQQGCEILQGNCFEPDRALPYAPLSDLFRGFCSTRSTKEIERDLGALAENMAPLLLELELSHPRPAPPILPEPEQEKRRLFQALTDFFTRRARPRALLLVIEDLHWSDDASLEFLLHLARRIAAQPILLLLTYRSEDAQGELLHFLAALDRGHLARETALKPLARAEVDTMLRAIFDLERPARSEFLDSIYALTEGTPFFVEEVLKSLIAAGEIFYANGIWDRKPMNELNIPRSVQDAVQQRVEQLSAETRQTLALTALAGRRFDFMLLAALTNADETALVRQVKELIAAQLLVEESADQFAFRHELTRQAVNAGLLGRERKALHRVIAEAMEKIYAEALEAHITDLAFHFHEAGAWEKALGYARRAGERAQALYAPRSAVEQFSRALEAASRLGQTTLLYPLYRIRGQAYETLGDFDAAQADYDRAMQTARNANDRRAEWQCWIDLGLLWASRDYNKTGEYFERALGLARASDDPATLAHSLNRMGNWRLNVEETIEALRYHREALDIFQKSNDSRGTAATLDLMGMAGQLSGDLVQGTAYYKQAVTLFRELDERQGLVSSLATMTLCGPTYIHNVSVSPSTLTELAEMGEQAAAIAGEIGWRSGEAYALICLGVCLGPMGEYQRAFQSARRALDIAEEIGHAQWTCASNLTLGLLQLDVLDLPTAQEYLERAHRQAREIGSSIWLRLAAAYLVPIYVWQKEYDRAESILDLALGLDAPMLSQGQRMIWCARGELALARGDGQSALDIVDKLISSAVNLSAERAIPRLWKLRGETLSRLGQYDDAEQDLRAALAAAEEQHEWALAWRIHVTLGNLYQAQSRREHANIEFANARQQVTEMAEKLPDDALRSNFVAGALAMMSSAPTLTPRRAEKEKFGGLTAREREVAALIAQGKSNREIAEELFVGVRTVEAHITRILDKLDFSSRAQIAVWAVEKGLSRPAQDE